MSRTLIGELEERDVAVDISDSASARLARSDVGRAILRGDVIEITGPYSPRRLPALRALPERRFDPTRTTWTVPLTRAGALAILDLVDHTNELVATRRARLALQRSATLTASTPHAPREPDPTAAQPDAAIAHRALAPPHERPDLREPCPRAGARSGHRAVRTRPR